MDALRISQRPGHRRGSGSRAWRAKRGCSRIRRASASAVPRGHVTPARAGSNNGSARIQTHPVKTRTTSAWTVTRDEEGFRLDWFLAAAGRLGSRGRVRVALERGQVFVNEVEAFAKDAGSRVAAGDTVRVWTDRPGSGRRRTRLRAFGASAGQALRRADCRSSTKTRSLLVVNKPAGLLAVPLERREGAPSLYERIEDHLRSRGKRRPLIVHRIDRDTSGLVVFAKTARAQQALKSQFKRREPERIYLALVVHGHPQPPHGTWRDRIVWDRKALIQKKAQATDPKASVAISDYRVLETFDGHVAHRGSPADGQAEPDSHAGRTARSSAGGRETLRRRCGADACGLSPAGASCLSSRVSPPSRRSFADVRGAPARRLVRPVGPIANGATQITKNDQPQRT